MNKKLIAVAVAAALATPAAMAEAIFYGKVRQSIDMYDYDGGRFNSSGQLQGDPDSDDWIEIRDQASRLGFKGSEDLGDGMKAVWQMEFGVNISNNGCDPYVNKGCSEFDAGSNVVTARNAFVGLAGDFGTVLVGRHDTPLKISTGSLDPFADTSADYNSWYMEKLTDLRADGTLAYISPSMNGLTIAAALVPGENNDADGIADAWSAAAMYSNGGLFLTAAMESGDAEIDALTKGDYDQWRVGGSYTMDALKVGAMYANTENHPYAGDKDTWSIFATYTMGNNVFKAKYFDVEYDIGSGSSYSELERDGFVIGVDHNFSARTQLSLLYLDSSETENYYSGSALTMYETGDTDILSVQLNHSF